MGTVYGDRSIWKRLQRSTHETRDNAMVTAAASLPERLLEPPSPEDQGLAKLAYSVALKIIDDPEEAKDIAQITMIALAARHRPPEHPEAWVTTVARNHAKNESRRRRRQDLKEPLADLPPIRIVEDVDQVLVRLVVREAIASLPLRQRQAVEFCYLEGLDRSEAAERMGIGTESIKTHLRRGFQGLRTSLVDEDTRRKREG
jgi:RNA polymerase sigma-70 factor (ECF subfamily)